jgi:hypothetical protein
VGWTWAAASRRGTSHERTGTKKQDALRVLCSGAGEYLIAIACDGAGSSSHGGQGAAIAARSITVSAKNALEATGMFVTDAAIWEWIDLARDQIAAVAKRLKLTPRDFATTVVMVISNGQKTITLHIGDGAAIARDRDAAIWIALSWPEHGEYASTTFFLTDEKDVRARISRTDNPVDRLAVFTDGIERLALDFNAGLPHTPFFTGISAPVAAATMAGSNVPLSAKLGDYLCSPAVNERTDDDKTLILAALR